MKHAGEFSGKIPD